MLREDEELAIRGPILIPAGWLIAILGAAVTGITLAFGIGVWVATVSSETKANSQEIAKLQNGDLTSRVIRIETILSLVYPEKAKEARGIASKLSAEE